MGWSAWQDPFEVTSTAVGLRLDYSAGGASAVALTGDEFESTFIYEAPDYGFTITGYQYKLQSTWETYRTFPTPMFDLTEGVDYIEVPGSPGVFYEYETGPNIFQGWDSTPLTLTVVNDALLRPFSMRMQTGTTYAAGTIPAFDPAAGTPFGSTWDGSTPIGTIVGAPSPGMASSFSMWPSQPPFDFTVNNSYQMNLGYVAARYISLLPRWRYWKPGILPLRQYPRNDGLKGGAPSARPTSRQATTARRTYL